MTEIAPNTDGLLADEPEAIVAEQHHGGRLAKLGLLAAVVSRIFGRLVGILLVVILAREADADTVAVYGYLLGTATLVATLTDLGVASIAGRDVAAGSMTGPAALRAALLPQSASLAAAALVTVVLTLGLGPAEIPSSALILTVVFVVIGGLNNLWGELLRATGRVVLEGSLQMVSAIALVAGGVIVIETGGSATTLLVIVVLKEALVLAVAMYFIRPKRDAAVRSRQLIGQSLWLALAGTALILLWRQGTLVIGATGSVAVLASYVVASRFLDAGVTLAHTAGFGLLPGMSAMAVDPGVFRRAVQKYLGATFVIGVVITVAGYFLAGPVTELLFGARWADAVPTVQMIALGALPTLLAFVSYPMLLARHQVKRLAAGCVAAVVVGMPLTILLFNIHGTPYSAAIGTTVGAWVLVVILLSGLRDLFVGKPAAVGAAA